MEEDMSKELGKIEQAWFGLGGYQECQIGIWFTLGGKSWGVGTGKGEWDATRIECAKSATWTEKDRSKQNDEIVRYVSRLLAEAKVDSVDKLVGIPIEATFDGTTLREWHILTEVL